MFLRIAAIASLVLATSACGVEDSSIGSRQQDAKKTVVPPMVARPSARGGGHSSGWLPPGRAWGRYDTGGPGRPRDASPLPLSADAGVDHQAPDASAHGSGDAGDDASIPTTCGNGIVEAGEACDSAIPAGSPGACPQSCPAGHRCAAPRLVGEGCQRHCSEPLGCVLAADGCCPVGCDANTDGDCQPACGNGVRESGEVCDLAIAAGSPGACPLQCDDGDRCTLDALVGVGCDAHCTHGAITACSMSVDGCRPSGCNAATDSDCGAVCGNGVVEPGERCDTGISAPSLGACATSCDDGNLCTNDVLVGSGCRAVCTSTPITRCSITSDGCCPSGCDANTDADCAP